MAAIDCCTREIVGWHLKTRCHARESIALVERGRGPRHRAATLTIGTDDGSAFTAHAFKLALSGAGVAHPRGGYRGPESPALSDLEFHSDDARLTALRRDKGPPRRNQRLRQHRHLGTRRRLLVASGPASYGIPKDSHRALPRPAYVPRRGA